MSKSQKPLEPTPVEPDDDIVIHQDHRHRHPSCSGDQLLARFRVLCDVLRRERNPMRRKKLFRRVAGLSGRGPVDRDLSIRHCSISSKKTTEDPVGQFEGLSDRGTRAFRRRVRLSPRSEMFFRPEEVDGRSE